MRAPCADRQLPAGAGLGVLSFCLYLVILLTNFCIQLHWFFVVKIKWGVQCPILWRELGKLSLGLVPAVKPTLPSEWTQNPEVKSVNSFNASPFSGVQGLTQNWYPASHDNAPLKAGAVEGAGEMVLGLLPVVCCPGCGCVPTGQLPAACLVLAEGRLCLWLHHPSTSTTA